MSLFEGASEFIISGGQFNHVAGNFYHLGSQGDSGQSVRKLIEKDSSLNQYSVEHGTVTIPRFSKSLLLQDLQLDPDSGRISSGSCSFDLLGRLGLFPGQSNEALAEYDTSVPLDEVVSRGNCYCGQISRHGFIFLVSKYFQHASMAETTKGGTCFILSTSIGRFKCYEIEDRIFIHFDSGTRSSYVDLVRDQNLEDILRTAQGEYPVASGVSPDAADSVFEWRRNIGEPLESVASGQFYGAPKAIIYMTEPTLQRWKRLKEFAYAMIDAIFSVLEGVREPVEFVTALKNLPASVEDNARSDKVAMSTPAEKLASCIYLYRALSRKGIAEIPYEYKFATIILQNMLEAHKYFRSPRVEITKLLKTSHDRFLQILDIFQRVDSLNGAGRLSNGQIQQELQKLLHNKNNVTLVALQGFFALLSQWNTSRVLLRAREAPDEWIRFVGTDDDELFIR